MNRYRERFFMLHLGQEFSISRVPQLGQNISPPPNAVGLKNVPLGWRWIRRAAHLPFHRWHAALQSRLCHMGLLATIYRPNAENNELGLVLQHGIWRLVDQL